MRVTRLPDVERTTGRAVAIGTFDGVHLGHREVIAGSDSVLTFDPHPVSVVKPQHTPRLLTTQQRKAELVASLGVSEMIVIPFDAEFASRPAAQFVDDVIVHRLAEDDYLLVINAGTREKDFNWVRDNTRQFDVRRRREGGTEVYLSLPLHKRKETDDGDKV